MVDTKTMAGEVEIPVVPNYSLRFFMRQRAIVGARLLVLFTGLGFLAKS